MRYLSVCSGIEAASVAWKPLGWECAGVSEIDKFPRAVLEHRLGAVPVDDDHRWTPGQNFTPLFGDFTKIEAHHVGPIDLLVGGTPCQSFSIAGKRLGLDDPRGNLTLEFLALARRVRARWIVWENVPGVLSHDEGRTFGTFLGLVGECGYRGAYRVIDAQYARVGRFGRAVPQRRRRLFFVGYSGTADINPAAVLFDRESLRGNPAPRREAGERPAPTLAARTRGGGGLGTDFDCDGGLISARMVAIGEYADDGVASAMKARDYKDATDLVAHSLRAEGFDASEGGTGRGTPIVPVQHPVATQERAVSENPNAGPDGKGWRDDGAAYTLEARSTVQAVASAFTFNTTQLASPQNGQDLGPDRPCHSLAAKDHPPAVAFAQNTRDEVRIQGDGHISGALAAEPGMKQQTYLAAAWGVRRLTPTECERLQGFPDGWTAIPWGKKTPEDCPDGPRYKALGNSMAVNVMCWIGERIQAVIEATET
jgi:DNA (cytosine-5)-methyltransferase 1